MNCTQTGMVACLIVASASVHGVPHATEPWFTSTSFSAWRVLTCRYAPQLVREIVKVVLERLGRPALHVADFPVDLEARVTRIRKCLADRAAGSAAVMGLHGMGGIGKTTLAKAVFNALQADFAGSSCFLEVGKGADSAALKQLQRQVLKELCAIDMDINSVAQGTAELEKRLHSQEVLLVIDDIWTAYQRDALLVPLKPGSHVVITTRNAQLLRSSSCPGMQIQPVDLLDSQAALELFSWSAFLAKQPPPGFSQLAAQAVEKCAGLPLTITVLGAYLWEQPGSQWRAALSRLHAAQPLTGCHTQDDELWGKLKLSYDALGVPEQGMFLDIACCMLGKQRDAVLPAWGAGAASTLRNLMGRSLVSVGENGQLVIHDQLRDMARAVVSMEHKEPALRSRVSMPEALRIVAGKEVGRFAGCACDDTQPVVGMLRTKEPLRQPALIACSPPTPQAFFLHALCRGWTPSKFCHCEGIGRGISLP